MEVTIQMCWKVWFQAYNSELIGSIYGINNIMFWVYYYKKYLNRELYDDWQTHTMFNINLLVIMSIVWPYLWPLKYVKVAKIETYTYVA